MKNYDNRLIGVLIVSIMLMALHINFLIDKRIEINFIDKSSDTIDDAARLGNEIQQLVMTGDYDLALKEINKAIKLKPEQAYFYLVRGSVYCNKNDFDSAVADFRRAIELSPKDATAHLYLGATYFNQRKLVEGIEESTKALEYAAPDDKNTLIEAYKNRAYCHELLGNKADAQSDWNRYLELDAVRQRQEVEHGRRSS